MVGRLVPSSIRQWIPRAVLTGRGRSIRMESRGPRRPGYRAAAARPEFCRHTQPRPSQVRQGRRASTDSDRFHLRRPAGLGMHVWSPRYIGISTVFVYYLFNSI